MVLAKGRTHGGGEVALWIRSMSSLEQKVQTPSNGLAWRRTRDNDIYRISFKNWKRIEAHRN